MFKVYIYHYNKYENDNGDLEDHSVHKVLNLDATTYKEAIQEIQHKIIDQDDGDFPDCTLFEVNNEWELDRSSYEHQNYNDGHRTCTWSKVRVETDTDVPF